VNVDVGEVVGGFVNPAMFNYT